MQHRAVLMLLLGLACTNLSFGQAAESRLVDVGGHSLWTVSAGKGGPTVVLESGFGDTHEPWGKVLPEIAKFTRVIAYDRAGYGRSQWGGAPQSCTQIAAELHTMLHNSNVPAPYVLVGHSFGGAIIRAFAHSFPSEVAGIVWVDPITEGMTKFMNTDQIKELVAMQDGQLTGAPEGARGEWEIAKRQLLDGFSELMSYGPPPSVPTMLMIAGTDRPPHWQESVATVYEPWVFAAPESGMVYLSGSTHYIQLDESAAVVSAIRRVVFPSPLLITRRTIKEKGIPAALDAYRAMWSRYPREFMRESHLNTLGYEQLSKRHAEDAIALFSLNTELFPKSFNAFDSLGEAYAAAGNKPLAIKNYRRSLQLNPQNKGAEAAIKSLSAKGS